MPDLAIRDSIRLLEDPDALPGLLISGSVLVVGLLLRIGLVCCLALLLGLHAWLIGRRVDPTGAAWRPPQATGRRQSARHEKSRLGWIHAAHG